MIFVALRTLLNNINARLEEVSYEKIINILKTEKRSSLDRLGNPNCKRDSQEMQMVFLMKTVLPLFKTLF